MSSDNQMVEKPHPQDELPTILTADAPSAYFGWHSKPSKVKQVLGWMVVMWLLVLMIGNQQGHDQDFYLIVTAFLIAVWLIRDLYLTKKSILPR